MADAVRYRPGWRQLPWGVLILMVLPVANAVSSDSAAFRVSVAASLALAVAVVVVQRHFGVLLRPDALVMVGLRPRVIPWHEIQRVDVSSLLGTRHVTILAPGGWTRLRAPLTTPFLARDPAFESKANTIYWCWREGAAATSASCGP